VDVWLSEGIVVSAYLNDCLRSDTVRSRRRTHSLAGAEYGQ
jgi:hypothetical protein